MEPLRHLRPLPSTTAGLRSTFDRLPYGCLLFMYRLDLTEPRPSSKSVWTQTKGALLRAHTAKNPEPPKGKRLGAGGELAHQSGVNKRRRKESRRLRRRRLFSQWRINGADIDPSIPAHRPPLARTDARSSYQIKAPTDHPISHRQTSYWYGTVTRTTEMIAEIHYLGDYLGKLEAPE